LIVAQAARKIRGLPLAILIGLFAPAPGFAEGAEVQPDGAPADVVPDSDADSAVQPHALEFTSADRTRQWELALNGYIDFGFAVVQGDGTNFAPGDTRVPADYVSDTFATAINSRGDVASISTSRPTYGFLPRSVGIGGKPSFLLNDVNQDLRLSSQGDRVMVFARAQFLPRYTAQGNQTQIWIEQAFARIVPFDSLELALSLGKFDSVFGIEYLDNPSNVRVGVTPSLIARYTTGQALGAKLFFRFHIPALWSSISFNLSATNGGTQVEPLQPVDISLTGRPVFGGRVGYELGLPSVELKLGASGLQGPRNDQVDHDAIQSNWGLDARFTVAGLSLSGEWIYFEEDESAATKMTGAGPQAWYATGFEVHGWYAEAAYRFSPSWRALTAVTVYARIEDRRGQFKGYPWIESRRLTPGLRVDLWSNVIVKAEWLFNREAAGALPVDNDVGVVSMVFSW